MLLLRLVQGRLQHGLVRRRIARRRLGLAQRLAQRRRHRLLVLPQPMRLLHSRPLTQRGGLHCPRLARLGRRLTLHHLLVCCVSFSGLRRMQGVQSLLGTLLGLPH